MPRPHSLSTRAMLRAYQNVRDGHDDAGYREDLAFLQSKDLDLSIRLGALLSFDGLLMAVAVNPIAASPGAPLSLDAPSHPVEVLVVSVGVALLGISAALCVRAIMLGEEFETDAAGDNPQVIVKRIFAAFCTSVDFQARMLRLASRFAIAGCAVSGAACGWIMIQKIFGL